MSKNDEWLHATMEALPEELSADEVASFLITVAATRLGIHKAMIILMSLPLTLAKTIGMTDSAVANLYALTAKDIAERTKH
jgi:hypothetical protein